MTDDVLDRLRAADPLADQPLPDPTDARAVAMRDQILTTSGDVVDLTQQRRRRRAVVVGVAVVAAAATAAALFVATRRPTDPTSVGCYAEASTRADTTVLAASGPNPVDPCRRLWEAGQMDPAVTSPAEVPPLVACVVESGAVGVFPASSCGEVATGEGPHETPDTSTTSPSPDPSPTAGPPTPSSGPDPGPTTTELPPELAMPDYQTSDETVRQALEEIRLEMIDRCLTLEAATALAEEILADHGIEGWTIEPIFDGHTDQTCAGFFPAAPEQTIWWTPEEPFEGQTPGPR